jgi:hypothetical protein
MQLLKRYLNKKKCKCSFFFTTNLIRYVIKEFIQNTKDEKKDRFLK